MVAAPKPKRRQSKLLPVYPSLSDVHRILTACPNERDAWLVKLLWFTGGRVSEVIAARVGDITRSGLKLPNLKQHQSAEKHVFLPPGFLAELRAYCAGRAPQDPIITHLADGKPIGRKMAWIIVTRAGSRAGVLVKRYREDGLRPPWCHSFRHGNAIHLLESGVPLNAVAGQLGHASLQSTAVYLKLADPDRERLVSSVTF